MAIRRADPARDAAGCAAIYAPYVTGGPISFEAIGLSRSAGYREVAPFNDEPFADHWFEKLLAPAGDRSP